MDLALIETGNGGDLRLRGTADLATIEGAENMLYLAMFGGSDWWGNSLIAAENPSGVFRSATETALLQQPLTSEGRIRIEEAIKSDLQDVLATLPGATAAVTTAIVASNRLDININLSGQQLSYSWNPDTQLITQI